MAWRLEIPFPERDDHSGVKRIVHLWAYNVATVPIDASCQIQVSTSDRDIGNVNRPCLIRLVYDCIAQEIGAYFCLLHPFGQVYFWINRADVHFIHIAASLPTYDGIAAKLQLCRHLSCSPGWMIRMKAIHDLLTGQFFL